MKLDRDAELVTRTRFNDKFFCSEFATLLLYEYFHNENLRKKIDDIAQGNFKALYGGKEIPGFQGFSLSISPLMAAICDQLYEITEGLTCEEEEDE